MTNTSSLACSYYVASGAHNQHMLEVLKILSYKYAASGLSALEVASKLSHTNGREASKRQRVYDAERLFGFVKAVGVRPCNVTGYHATIYTITSQGRRALKTGLIAT